MTHHIVMWKFKPEIADADKPRLLADMAQHLEGLVGQVPGLVELHFVAAPLASRCWKSRRTWRSTVLIPPMSRWPTPTSAPLSATAPVWTIDTEHYSLNPSA